MPKTLRYAVRENFATGRCSMEIFLDEGFSGDGLAPEKSLAAEAVILCALHFPREKFDSPDLEMDFPIRLSQAQLKWEMKRLYQRAVPEAVRCRNRKIFQEPAVEADQWDLRVKSLESVYG